MITLTKTAAACLARVGDDAIVWYRVAHRGAAVRCALLCRPERDALVRRFGEAWLDQYLADAEAELAAWAIVGDPGSLIH